MRRLALLLALAPSAFALNNSVTITDGGTGQSARPFSISRVFACGEFPAGTYPQAHVLGGAAITPYQVDVMTTCADGSVRHAIVSFTQSIAASGSVIIDFVQAASRTSTWAQPSRAADQADMLAFNSSAWGGQIQAVASGVTLSASARAMMAAGYWRYWLNGPVVRQAIIEDRFNADGSPTGTFTYDFGFQCDSSTGGTCPPVLSGSPPTYAATVWKAASDAAHKSLHPIFVATFYTGWPGVKTEFILENSWFGKVQDQQFDLTLWNGGAETNSVYNKTATVFPAFRRMRETFWDGSAPNGWINTDGNGGQIGVAIDYNLKYLEYSKAVPFYNPYLPAIPDNPVINYEVAEAATSYAAGSQTQWCGNGSAAYMCANFNTNQGLGGNQGSMAVIPRPYVRYLGSFSAVAYRNMIDNGQMAAILPLHVRESVTGKHFVAGQTTDAFGRVLSADARPQYVMHMNSYSQAQAADRFDPGHGTLSDGSISCRNSAGYNLWCSINNEAVQFQPWVMDYAHFALFSYVPYLITGDWYFLENQQFAAAFVLGGGSTGDSGTTPSVSWNTTPSQCYIGHRAPTADAATGTPDSDYGYNGNCDVIRAEAWSFNNLAHAWFMSPDGSAEKTYFTEKMDRYAATLEGRLDLRTGNYFTAPNPGSATDPCNTSTYTVYKSTPWCFGHNTGFGNRANPLGLLSWVGESVSEGLNISTMKRSDSPWWYAYYGTSIHRAEELGFSKIKPVRQALARGIISQVMDSSVTGPDGKWVGPEPHGAYRQMITQPDGQSAQSWLAVFNAIERSTTIVNAIGSGDASLLIADQCTNSNYGSIGVGSSSMWIDGGQYFRIDGGTANEEIIQTGCSCSNAVPYSTVTMTGGTCPGKRGALGTTAKAHAAGASFERLFLRSSDAFYSSKESGQYNQSVGAASLAYDVSAPDTLNGRVYTGLRAVEVMRAVQALQNWDSDTSCTSVTSNPSRNCMNWMWAILPRQTIGDAQVLPGTTSALLTWTAPDTYACRVGVSGTAFTSSDDTADSVSPAGPAARSYTATGLMGQTNYFYRITCGSGGGTSRFSGTFKTN